MTTSPLPLRLVNRVKATHARLRLENEFARLMRTASPHHGTGPKIGIATFGSGAAHFVLEALLAQALAARGAQPEFLVCDLPDLPICDERTIHSRHQERCDGCLAEKRPLLQVCGLPWKGLSAFVAAGTLSRARSTAAALAPSELTSYVERGWPIGQWLHVSASHYLRRDARGDAEETIDVRRRLLTTAIVTVEAVERWLNELTPAIVIAESGAHLVWRIAMELARSRGIPVVCREIGKGGWDSHLYALNADCMAPDLSAAWTEARGRALSPDEEGAVDRFLADLPAQTYVQRAPIVRVSPRDLRASLRLPDGAPVAVAFTNVSWDLASAGRDRAFAGQYDWLRDTIRVLAPTGAHLIIRAHPAEGGGLTREKVGEWFAAEWPEGLPHVTIIGPDDTTAARDFCAIADLTLAYNSHVAIEAAASGHAVVVAGNPHYRAHGFTIDVDSRALYAEMLQAWVEGQHLVPPSGSAVLAKRYCYLFFFRYHTAMNWTTSPLELPYRLRIRSLKELTPGRSAVVDAVCDAILHQHQLVLPRTAGARA